MFEADEDTDEGISSRGCRVVGGADISGAAGGGGGGNEKALGAVKEAEAGIDDSGCSEGDVENVPDVGGRTFSRCSGSPACSPGKGKLAVLRRPILFSLDGGVVLPGTMDGHGASFSSSRST